MADRSQFHNEQVKPCCDIQGSGDHCGTHDGDRAAQRAMQSNVIPAYEGENDKIY